MESPTLTDTADVEAAAHFPLRQPGSKLPLGSLLVRDGVIEVHQLEDALAEQEQTGRRLGEVLVERGWISERALAEALAEQHELEFVDLGDREPDPDATSLLPEKFARRYDALPISFVGEDTLLVAVADPTDLLKSDDLRLALGVNVRLAVAAIGDLREAIGRSYRTELEIGDTEVPYEDEQAPDISEDVEELAPAVRLVNSLISRALEEGASDIHFEPQAEEVVVRIRVDGVTRRLAFIPKGMQAAVASRLKVMGGLDIAERRAPQDGRVSIRVAGEPTDLRVAVLPTTFGEQIVLRILQRASGGLGLSDLGMSDDAEAAFVRAIRQPHGIVLVCGPTGSGKTTTLYAALDVLNSEDRVITTIEDPVEYRIPGVVQIEVNARSGLTFPRGLRTILRSDPDVLLVGEIRDEETAAIATQAAMTGHLVLTTLHAHNASSAVARMKQMGVDPQLLASSVNAIVAQRLARRLCLECREAYEPSPAELAELGADKGVTPAELYRAAGCVRCGGTGYRGRIALYEVLAVQGNFRGLIEGAAHEFFAAAVEHGMETLGQAGNRLCLDGITSLDEIRRITGDRIR
jgi:type IV pilus assembly protein PilB